MKAKRSRSRIRISSPAGVLTLVFAATSHANPPAPGGRAALVGGALPGGAAIGARSVILTPAGARDATAGAIAAHR